MTAKQAPAKSTSSMLGNDREDIQLVLKTFYSWRGEQSLENNVELTKLFPMTKHADRGGGLEVCGDSKIKSGSKPKQLVT